MKTPALLLTLALLVTLPAGANELKMIISGKAIHIGSNDLNEKNYGLGLQYDFTTHPRWIPLINLASFKDSNGNTSKYIGGGIKRRFKLSSGAHRVFFDLGAAGLVMKRPEYNDDKPFAGVLPFISFSNSWGGINATYVPEVEKDTLPAWYFQFTVKLLQF